MTPYFRTPRRYQIAAGVTMVVNLANINTFSDYILYWQEQGSLGSGLLVIATHLLTILLLSGVSGHLASQGMKFAAFIRLMEHNGFVYLPQTKEFKQGTKI
ncbi:hypothetical protein IAJ44_004333 [Salmonella enterica]|nr:hypothetical protein [Salmonella enterica]